LAKPCENGDEAEESGMQRHHHRLSWKRRPKSMGSTGSTGMGYPADGSGSILNAALSRIMLKIEVCDLKEFRANLPVNLRDTVTRR